MYGPTYREEKPGMGGGDNGPEEKKNQRFGSSKSINEKKKTPFFGEGEANRRIRRLQLPGKEKQPLFSAMKGRWAEVSAFLGGKRRRRHINSRRKRWEKSKTSKGSPLSVKNLKR